MMVRNLTFVLGITLLGMAFAGAQFRFSSSVHTNHLDLSRFDSLTLPDAPRPPVNLESPQVHPLDLSPDQRWLAAANTFGDRVELFELVEGIPQFRHSLYTGLNPVSVRFRTNEELWVVNHVSDSISLLEVPSGRVARILETHDEPADVIFSERADRAFVSCSQANCLLAYDLSDLMAPPVEIPIQGEDPRALTVSADGRFVFAAIFESGNGTTVLGGGRADSDRMNYPPNVVNAPDSPYGGTNPPPNDGETFSPSLSLFPSSEPVSLIVRKSAEGRWIDDNEGDWTPFVSGERASESGRVEGWDLADHDLAIIDTETHAVTYAKGLMNLCMAIDVNEEDGTISMVGTDAMNHIRYEPNLKGVFARVKQATVRVLGDGTAEILSNTDLNPHLDYSLRSVPQKIRDLSIGDPRAIVSAREGGRAYVAGMGSNNVIVTGPDGGRLLDGGTIEVGEGPTGLVLNAGEDRLYVLNRFDASISVVDTAAGEEIERVTYIDPTPEVIKIGRKHLYDTHAHSGLGHVSCATCHVDARMDRLAWDLGDPGSGASKLNRFVDQASGAFEEQTVRYASMKGPMVTQTLQGLIGNGPFHWRGDKDDVEDFNVFYVSLLGADERLSEDEMKAFKDYLNTITFPPNPFREVDHSMPEKVDLPGHHTEVDGQRVPLPAGDPVRGRELFLTESLNHFAGRRCSSCHGGGGEGGYGGGSGGSGGGGGSRPVVSVVSELESLTQREFKPSQLRNLHEKLGFDAGSEASLSGFGYLHDGTIDSLTRYLTQPRFEEVGKPQDLADTIAFLFSQNGINSTTNLIFTVTEKDGVFTARGTAEPGFTARNVASDQLKIGIRSSIAHKNV
ncbi:MAG: beta-propeller fold lactonase family protein, partial [Verrucomicrobiota bacterium]